MKLKIVARDAEEGGYWAEVPAIPAVRAGWYRQVI